MISLQPTPPNGAAHSAMSREVVLGGAGGGVYEGTLTGVWTREVISVLCDQSWQLSTLPSCPAQHACLACSKGSPILNDLSEQSWGVSGQAIAVNFLGRGIFPVPPSGSGMEVWRRSPFQGRWQMAGMTGGIFSHCVWWKLLNFVAQVWTKVRFCQTPTSSVLHCAHGLLLKEMDKIRVGEEQYYAQRFLGGSRHPARW